MGRNSVVPSILGSRALGCCPRGVWTRSNPGVKFNAATETYEDLVKSGVIDPTKVVRTPLQNAASVAILLLTTDALVSDLPEKEKEGAGAGHSH